MEKQTEEQAIREAVEKCPYRNICKETIAGVIKEIDERISTERITCNMLANSDSMKKTFSKEERFQKVEAKDYLISILEEIKDKFAISEQTEEVKDDK